MNYFSIILVVSSEGVVSLIRYSYFLSSLSIKHRKSILVGIRFLLAW
jgi:hypothetical protein